MYKRMVLEFCAVDQNYTCSMYMLYMYIHCMKCTYTVQACLCMSHGLYVGHTCIAPNVCIYSVCGQSITLIKSHHFSRVKWLTL